MDKFFVSETPDNKEILEHMQDTGAFADGDTDLSDFENGIYEFTLDELGLPDSKTLLAGVEQVEKEIGLQGWIANNQEAKSYKGFALTYNKDFSDPSVSEYHQVWGHKTITNTFSRKDAGVTEGRRNTYYDTYGFRHVHPIIYNAFEDVFKKIAGAVVRSRCAYVFTGEYKDFPNDYGWHIDEIQYTMLRIVIPVKTSPEHVMQLKINDDEILEKHLKLDHAYVWNQRAPHRVTATEVIAENDPRIHLIFGFTPWFNYDEAEDCFYKNENYGIKLAELVKDKKFVK